MPYTVKWLVEKHIGLITLIGCVTIDELRQANQDATLLLRLSESPLVHVIADFSRTISVPQDIAQLNGIMRVLHENNIGWVLTVGMVQPELRYVATLLLRHAGISYMSVKQISDALMMIDLLDSSAPSMVS